MSAARIGGGGGREGVLYAALHTLQDCIHCTHVTALAFVHLAYGGGEEEVSLTVSDKRQKVSTPPMGGGGGRGDTG